MAAELEDGDPLGPTVTPEPRGSGARRQTTSIHVGRTLQDRWVVEARIGMGGMAAVHRGVDLRLGRPVAVKILHAHVAESAEARERLAREARAIAQLKHQNVIEVYDYSIDDPGCVWLVTELVEGASLRAFVDRHPKTLPEVAALVTLEIVRALRAAHAVGVVHRDVKPDNVLVSRDGRPKLSDFGIAQIVDEQRMTVTGSLVGSPSYMSPEQAEGRRIDHRTDLFSVGIVLYRLVTGVLPFQGGNAIETLRRVAAVIYTDPIELEPSLPGAVVAIIRRALAPSLDARYASADELAHDLAAVVRSAGLGHADDELPGFFGDPTQYEAETVPRIARALSEGGQRALAAGRRAEALESLGRARALGGPEETPVDLAALLAAAAPPEAPKRSLRGLLGGAAGGALAGALLTIAVVGTAPELAANGRPPSALAGPSGVGGPSPLAGPGPSAPAGEPGLGRGAAAEPIAPPTPTLAANPALSAPPPGPSEAAPPASDPPRASTPGAPRPAAPRREPAEATAANTRAEPAEPEPRVPAPATPRPEPSPEPATAELGELQIGTQKWVEIFIDGQRLGRAPDRSRYALPPGRHRLRATNPACDPVDQDVEIRAQETTRVRLTIVCP